MIELTGADAWLMLGEFLIIGFSFGYMLRFLKDLRLFDCKLKKNTK